MKNHSTKERRLSNLCWRVNKFIKEKMSGGMPEGEVNVVKGSVRLVRPGPLRTRSKRHDLKVGGSMTLGFVKAKLATDKISASSEATIAMDDEKGVRVPSVELCVYVLA